ncbi:MAG: hypothetical protein M3144_11525, partial [Actinomycetota bacterium]|nr:hypothetical protein [Actinomycetota bacterium]
MTRTRLAVVVLTVVGAAVVVPQMVGAASITITMRDNFFDPFERTVTVNDQVQWTNAGFNPHTATFETLPIDTGTISPGQTS